MIIAIKFRRKLSEGLKKAFAGLGKIRARMQNWVKFMN